MVKDDDLEAARDFYRDRLGLIELWQDDSQSSIGMRFVESDAEILLHTMDLPVHVEVTYLIDNVEHTVKELKAHGTKVVREPFHITIGKCAAFEDPSGNVVSILDMTRGPRPTLAKP
jgi:predicted enzyme related to lactoylglutathione lyase